MLDFKMNCLLQLSQSPTVQGLKAIQLSKNINQTNWLLIGRQIFIHLKWKNVYMSF